MFLSYLKTLLVPFNEVTSKFIERLKPLADGVIKVSMKLCFGGFTESLDVISKVNCTEYNTFLGMSWTLSMCVREKKGRREGEREKERGRERGRRD